MRGLNLKNIVVAVLLAVMAMTQPVCAQSVIPLPSGQLSVTTKEKSFPVKLRAFINPFADPAKPNWATVDPEEVWSSDNGTRPDWTDQDDVYVFVDVVGLKENLDMIGLSLDQFQNLWTAFKTPYGYAVRYPPGSMRPVLYSVQPFGQHHADRKIYSFLIFSVQTAMQGLAVSEMVLHVHKAPPGWQQLSRGLRHRIRMNYTKVQSSDMELDLPPSLAQALAAERAGQTANYLPSTASAVTTTTIKTTTTATAKINAPGRPLVSGVSVSFMGLQLGMTATISLSEKEKMRVPLTIRYSPGTTRTRIDIYDANGKRLGPEVAVKTTTEANGGRAIYFPVAPQYPPGYYTIKVQWEATDGTHGANVYILSIKK